MRRYPYRYHKVPIRTATVEPEPLLSNTRPAQRLWPTVESTSKAERIRSQAASEKQNKPDSSNQQAQASQSAGETALPETEPNWQTVAARLQQDMQAFRRRQQQQAESAATLERERLLGLMLPVVDNLRRALDHETVNESALHQGVELTYREFARLLAAEGIERIDSIGQAFDPTKHEALATRSDSGPAGIIIEEVEPGYLLSNKLLRPAKVVVAA